MSEFYAHTAPGDTSNWEPLFTADCAALAGGHCALCERLDPKHGHLNKVAWWTATFTEALFPAGSAESKAARAWGYLAGLWHDLGKFHSAFQRKLSGERLQIEHAGAGAFLAQSRNFPGWERLAFVIAGHHSGLANSLSRESMEDKLTPLEQRLERAAIAFQELPKAEIEKVVKSSPVLGPLPLSADGGVNAVAVSTFIRLLFSALIDGDSLATEAFCSQSERKTLLRWDRIYDPVPVLRIRLDERLDSLAASCEESPVNAERARILAWCRDAATQPPGFFQLNVPTGGGKTLAAMSFALRHVCHHAARRMRRVVVAVPYTTIIEQNAGIYRDILGAHNLIEHHSNLDDFAETEETADELTIRRRLACENWDAPIIVTTNVQLFESLFAHKRRRGRKLHNLAGSVIVLDEAQSVPAEYLHLILSALRDLVENYGCTIVVSTATQPAWKHRRTLPFGVRPEHLHSIVPGSAELSKMVAFDRVKIEWPISPKPTSHEELAMKLIAEPCVMAIVHRKKDAQHVARLLRKERPEERVFHLSTNMCPVHRRSVLKEIGAGLKEFRQNGTPCRVVSTQLVEAGVDLDFPVIYRALAGLDSIAQAAGRCNREGRLQGRQGRLIVFLAESEPPDGHLKQCAEITQRMLEEHGRHLDLRNPAIFEEFFVRLYRDRNLDAKNLVRHARDLNFETLGREFRLIEDENQTPVVVLLDDEARKRLREVERMAEHSDSAAGGRYALRALQSYTVLVRPAGMKNLIASTVPLLPESQTRVLDPEFYSGSYDPVFGLVTDDEPRIDPQRLIA